MAVVVWCSPYLTLCDGLQIEVKKAADGGGGRGGGVVDAQQKEGEDATDRRYIYGPLVLQRLMRKTPDMPRDVITRSEAYCSFPWEEFWVQTRELVKDYGEPQKAVYLHSLVVWKMPLTPSNRTMEDTIDPATEKIILWQDVGGRRSLSVSIEYCRMKKIIHNLTVRAHLGAMRPTFFEVDLQGIPLGQGEYNGEPFFPGWPQPPKRRQYAFFLAIHDLAICEGLQLPLYISTPEKIREKYHNADAGGGGGPATESKR